MIIGHTQRGPYDTIFINFVDHGSTGLLSFPNEYLYADQLNDAFNAMYKTSSYKKVIIVCLRISILTIITIFIYTHKLVE